MGPVLILGPSVMPTMTPMDTNLAAVIKKDGSLVGMWRDHHPTGKSVPHLVTATHWKDPSTYKFSEADLLFSSGSDANVDGNAAPSSDGSRRRKAPSSNPGGLEDMFLWAD